MYTLHMLLEEARSARRSRDEQAAVLLARALAAYPESLELRIEYAALLMDEGEYEAALSAWQAILDRHAGAPWGVRLRKANALRRLGRLYEARIELEPLLDLRPDDGMLLLEAAELYAETGERAKAELHFERARRLDTGAASQAAVEHALRRWRERWGVATHPEARIAQPGPENLERARVLGVSLQLDPGDSMHHGSDDQYFDVGASALDCVVKALALGGMAPAALRRMLDYACGYGRVARWLRAAFPEAELLCVDADPQAVSSVQSVLSLPARLVDPKAPEVPTQAVDLIWTGSLLTHLDTDGSHQVLEFLGKLLSPGGILVATMHGPFVAQRIRNGERDYGLRPLAQSQLLSRFDATGYGYANYPGRSDYGVSAATSSRMEAIAGSAGLATLAAWERRWASHQDVYVFRRSADESTAGLT